MQQGRDVGKTADKLWRAAQLRIVQQGQYPIGTRATSDGQYALHVRIGKHGVQARGPLRIGTGEVTAARAQLRAFLDLEAQGGQRVMGDLQG